VNLHVILFVSCVYVYYGVFVKNGQFENQNIS